MARWGTHASKIFFCVKYAVESPVDFRGPIGERYAGLYYLFMERHHHAYDCFWYAGDEGVVYEYDPLGRQLRAQGRDSLTRVVLRFVAGNLRARKTFVVSYPYFPGSWLLALLLRVLRPLRVRVIVDVQDLPVSLRRHRSREALEWAVVDALFWRSASFVVNAAECVRLYHGPRGEAPTVIPMGAHHDIITPPVEREAREGLLLFYLGTIGRRRGFPEFVEMVDSLRRDGLPVGLLVIGSNAERIDLTPYPWLEFREPMPLDHLARAMQGVDVGVIPYVDADYWGAVSITKMAAYMAAGLPIVSMRLVETSNILARWHCGLSVDDWQGMAEAIRTLASDGALRQRLAKNARSAAVAEYNWDRQVERLAARLRRLSGAGGQSNEVRPDETMSTSLPRRATSG